MRNSRPSGAVLVLVLLISALPVAADTITESTGITLLNSTYGYVSIHGAYSYSDTSYYSTSGPFSNSATGALTLPGLSLPAGSTLNSATLTLSGASGPSTPSVDTTVTYEYVGSFLYGYGSYFVCDYYFFGSCVSWHYQQYPEYVGGSPGSISDSGNGNSYFTNVNSGANTAGVGPAGGSYDLLAMGFGSDLLAGNPFTVGAQSDLGINFGIVSYGSADDMTFLLQTGSSNTFDATLTVDYTPPVGVPEPASMVMFGSGLLGLAGLLRRKLSA